MFLIDFAKKPISISCVQFCVIQLPFFVEKTAGILVFALLPMAFISGSDLAVGEPAEPPGFRAVHIFAGDRGAMPLSGLTASDPFLFGTTYRGGKHNAGVLFSFNPATGTMDVLHHFDGVGGREPMDGLVVEDRAIFGATKSGGATGHGVLYRYDRITGSFDILHEFAARPDNGFYPHASPVRVGETLFGTTFHGGETVWGGAVYAFHLRTMEFRVLYSLSAETGRHPLGRLLHLDGWFYGLGSDYGHHAAGAFGTLFRARADGSAFEVLHRFGGGERGSTPFGGLSHDGGGLLFGSTFGNVGDMADGGTVFSHNLDTGGNHVLRAFSGFEGSGAKPCAAPLYDPSRERLFGVCQGTDQQGTGVPGVLWSMRPDGTDFRVLHAFGGGISGRTPVGALQRVGDSLYGVTAHGGVEAFGRSPTAAGQGILYRYVLGSTDDGDGNPADGPGS